MTPTPLNRNKNRKPGLTAKGDQRQYVQHSYTDRSNDPIQNLTTSDENTLRLYKEDSVGGPFPIKLHIVLKVTEKLGQQHIISWLPHGRSFMIHRPREFEEEVMGKFFKQTKLTSFRRQLNLYDFQRITHGRDAGSYYHELFLRGRPLLAKRMIRRKVKGTKIRASSSPDDEPNFYTMAFMGPITDYPANHPQGAGPPMDHRPDQMLGAMAGAGLNPSLSMQQAGRDSAAGGAASSSTGVDGNASRQFDPASLQQQQGGVGLQSPLHNQNPMYSDLMRSSLNRMPYGQYGGGMNDLELMALRNRLAYAPYMQQRDAAAIFDMARLQSMGYNEQLLRASQMGMGFPNAHGAGAAPSANLSSMLLGQQRGFDPLSNSTEATRLLLGQMGQQSQANNALVGDARQSTAQSQDEKQNNAIEQLLLLQKDRSATNAAPAAADSTDPAVAAPKEESESQTPGTTTPEDKDENESKSNDDKEGEKATTDADSNADPDVDVSEEKKKEKSTVAL